MFDYQKGSVTIVGFESNWIVPANCWIFGKTIHFGVKNQGCRFIFEVMNWRMSCHVGITSTALTTLIPGTVNLWMVLWSGLASNWCSMIGTQRSQHVSITILKLKRPILLFQESVGLQRCKLKSKVGWGDAFSHSWDKKWWPRIHLKHF